MRAKLFILIWIIVFILAFAVGTNVLPLMVPGDYGPPHAGVFYEPFHIIWWTIKLDFITAVDKLYTAYLIIVGIIFIASFILISTYKNFKLKAKGLHGSSRWMNEKELKKSGILTAGGIILGQDRRAVYKETGVGKWTMKKPGRILFNNSPEHVLIVAPTRRGKGINNVVPSLLHWPGSTVVYDLKKENWEITAGWRSKFSHVLRFEPTSPTSVKFNPMLEIEKGDAEVPQVQNLAKILVDPYGEAKNDHWTNSAFAVLVGIILHLLYAGRDKSLYGVYRSLNDPHKPPLALFKEMANTMHLGDRPHPQVEEAAQNMLNKTKDGEPTNEFNSIVSTASLCLTLYQDPIIARNTSSSDFRIADLMDGKQPASLYLVVKPSDAERMKPLTRLVLQMIGRKLTSRGVVKTNHRLLFLIDEFPALGNMEFFEQQLAFFAGYGIKCVIITQSYNQLYKYYGQNTSIPDNCRVKVILGADSEKEAEILSRYLGQETVARKSVSRSGKASSMILSGRSESHSEAGRALMTPDEVLRMPFDEIVVMAGGTYPYNAKKIMFYQDPRFKPRMNLDTPEELGIEKLYYPEPTRENCWNIPEEQEIKEELESEEGEQPPEKEVSFEEESLALHEGEEDEEEFNLGEGVNVSDLVG